MQPGNVTSERLSTPLTKLLGIKHPIILAGMNAVSHSKLVAAVTVAGGLGVLGGLSLSPKMLKQEIAAVKAELRSQGFDPHKFGVDLALPQVGGSARATNHDYTHGKLPELIKIVCEERGALFVSAVGVPPKWAVDQLHEAGIPVMNMCGAPQHVDKALAVGVDIMCAQGTEGGGHTGDIATSVLLPMIVDYCKGKKSLLTGEEVMVVGAGGIYDGRGLAMALSYGCVGVWVGTRFVASQEASAPKRHKQAVIQAGPNATTRTLVYTGRPLRTLMTHYLQNWHDHRSEEIKELTNKGKIPFMHDMESKSRDEVSLAEVLPLLMGQVAGVISDLPPARQIVEEMVRDCIVVIRKNANCIVSSL
eukprot:gb/GEZN01002677.1/.p1 GENE.gb/GEZN01002677.1/~~gb/GEZN01002677.1/.p1  ORF type:complete len:362 (-),score=63.51 gb/GEZN01002677.1/:1011-2096(-)